MLSTRNIQEQRLIVLEQLALRSLITRAKKFIQNYSPNCAPFGELFPQQTRDFLEVPFPFLKVILYVEITDLALLAILLLSSSLCSMRPF